MRVLVRKPLAAYADDPGVQVVVGDLGDPRIVDHAVAGAKLVYHVGAAMKGSLRDFEAGTTWGTRNVVESCLAHGTSRLVYVSSLSVLDHAGRDPTVRVVESSALEPQPQKRGAYTQTKLAAACFHLALFCTAVWLTWRKGEWINEMWTMYFMAAVGHAAYDKTLANVRAYKDKQLGVSSESMTTTTTITTTPITSRSTKVH